MNALLFLLCFFANLFGSKSSTSLVTPGSFQTVQSTGGNQADGAGNTRMNPRTVIVLEDTHFRPTGE